MSKNRQNTNKYVLEQAKYRNMSKNKKIPKKSPKTVKKLKKKT